WTDQSSCAVHTPIEPTDPEGVTTSSSAWEAIQYAADAASALATAVVGVLSRRIRSAVSGTSSTDPPGESTSRTMWAIWGSASSRRSVAAKVDSDVAPDTSVNRFAFGKIGPYSGTTATDPRVWLPARSPFWTLAASSRATSSS